MIVLEIAVRGPTTLRLAALLTGVLALGGPAWCQDTTPSKLAPGNLESAVIQEFQDLANAKQISGKLKSVDLKKRTIEVTTEDGKEPQRFILDRKVSVWAKLSITGDDSSPASALIRNVPFFKLTKE